MRAKLKRNGETVDVEFSTITLEINGTVFRLKQSVDDKLTINKISSDGTDDVIRVFPRTGNEIEVN